MPDYFTTFAGIVLELLTLVAPNSPHLVDEVVQIGARAFNLSENVVAFMTDELLPAPVSYTHLTLPTILLV